MLACSDAPDAEESGSRAPRAEGSSLPDLVGSTLPGGWQVVRHVGIGSMGHVYEAKHVEDGPARVAVKVLHTELVANKEVAFRFRREAEILDQIDSPHVPRLFDRGRDAKGRAYFVMEYVAGVELFKLLDAQKCLPAGLALEIARQMCRALGAAHRAGVIHRDLKPENVMLRGDVAAPSVKILDFSVSKMDDFAFTHAGTVLGTPSYMPREQALGAEATPLVDVYAVGAVLYDMLCGRPPFDEGDPGKTLGALLTTEAPRPRELEPTIPEEVEVVLLRAIAREPERRYASVRALESEIDLLLGGISGRRIRVASTSPETPPPARDDDDEGDRQTSVPDGARLPVLAAGAARVETSPPPRPRAAAVVVWGVLAVLLGVALAFAAWGVVGSLG